MLSEQKFIMNSIKMALVFMLVLSFSACGIKTVTPQDTTTNMTKTEIHPRQSLLKNIIPTFDHGKMDWLTVDLPEVGLNNLTIGCVENGYIIKDNNSEQKTSSVYILCDYTVSTDMYHIPYLAVVLNDKVLIKDLSDGDEYSGSYNDALFVADVNGDGADEIIVHQALGMSGGAGSFLSRIFKVNGDNIEEIFTSILQNSDNSWHVWDTGFTSEFLNGRKLEITNKFTGYSTTIDISQRYSEDFFDTNSKGKTGLTISCDGFKEFVPKDVDNDGIYELVCLQYVSLADHSDYIGDVRSVLKHNQKTQTFEVTQSEFIKADTK